MKISILIVIILITNIVLITTSCKKDNGNVTNISKYGLTDSHNMGRNCIDCHKSGGSGQGWFNVAGTAYDSNGLIANPNGTINLFSGANGTGNILLTVQVDGKGNFYTTEAIDFGSNNIFPSITGHTGNTKYMLTKAPTGACNSCHDATTYPRVWVN
jgi:hypothetical protein